MRFPRMFEGPLLTLFLREGHFIRIINDRGEEALLPFGDFHRFLQFLAAHAFSLHLSPAAAAWLTNLL